LNRLPPAWRRTARFPMRNSTLPTATAADAAQSRIMSRQPHEFLYSLQAGAHRRRAHHQPYMENLWAELPESKSAPSRCRWPCSIPCMSAGCFCSPVNRCRLKRTFRHPDLGLVSLEKNLASTPGTDASLATSRICAKRWDGRSALLATHT